MSATGKKKTKNQDQKKFRPFDLPTVSVHPLKKPRDAKKRVFQKIEKEFPR